MKKIIHSIFVISLLLIIPRLAFAGDIGIDVGGQYRPINTNSTGSVDLFQYLNMNWIRIVGSNTSLIPSGKNVVAVYQNNCGDPNAEQTFINQVKPSTIIKAVQVGNEINKEPDHDPKRPEVEDGYWNCTPEAYAKQLIHFYDELKDSKSIIFGSPYISDDLLQNDFNVDPTTPLNSSAAPTVANNVPKNQRYNYVNNYFIRFYNALKTFKNPDGTTSDRTGILSAGDQALRIGVNFYINEGETRNSAYNVDRLNVFINAIKNLNVNANILNSQALRPYVNSKFWITEYGWRSAPDYLNSLSPAQIDEEIKKHPEISPENQKDFDRDATNTFKGRSDVEVAFLFSLHDVSQGQVGNGALEWRNLGLIDHRTNTLKPVFYEIENISNPGFQKSCNATTITTSTTTLGACVASGPNCEVQTLVLPGCVLTNLLPAL